MVSLPFVVYLDTTAGTSAYVVDVANDPIFFNTPSDSTSSSLSSGFSPSKSTILGVEASGAQGPVGTVTGKTQITVTFTEDPGNNHAFKITGFLQY